MQEGGIETRSELCDNVRHFRSKAHVVSDVVDSVGQFKLKVVEHVLNGPVTRPVWWPGKYAMTSKVHSVEDLYTVVSREIVPHERPLHKAWRPMERQRVDNLLAKCIKPLRGCTWDLLKVNPLVVRW